MCVCVRERERERERGGEFECKIKVMCIVYGRLERRVNSRLTDPRRQDVKQGNSVFLKNVSDITMQ